MSGHRPLAVLGFGTYDAARHPRVRVILDGLRLRDFDVTECNVPLGFSTAERVRMLRQPWRLPVLLFRVAARWTALSFRAAAMRRTRRPDAVVVGYLGHFDVLLARLLFPRTPVVLDHLIFAGTTAADRGVAGGIRVRALAALDRLAISASTITVVDTAEHAAMVSPRRAASTLVVPVGAERSWFAAGDEAAAETPGSAESRLSVIFYGLMTPLQGATVVAQAVAQLGGDVDVTVVGTGQDGPAVDRFLHGVPHVRRIAWVQPAALPALVASHDVCLGIFGTSAKALSVVPNKVYQGIAAGRAVITSDTPPQRRAASDGAVFVAPGDVDGLVSAIRGLAADRDGLREQQARALARRQAFAPEVVVGEVSERLKGAIR